MRVEFTEEMVNDVFETAGHQREYVEGLFSVLFGDKWDTVEKVIAFPKCGDKISSYIWDKAIAFDKKNHPDVMAGGLWLNCGWSTDHKLSDWIVEWETHNIKWCKKKM